MTHVVGIFLNDKEKLLSATARKLKCARLSECIHEEGRKGFHYIEVASGLTKNAANAERIGRKIYTRKIGTKKWPVLLCHKRQSSATR